MFGEVAILNEFFPEPFGSIYSNLSVNVFGKKILKCTCAYIL